MPGEEADIGHLGEADLRRWCARINASCSKADPDKFGWDFFVEFSQSIDSSVPLDRQNDLRKILVQVKSSRRRSSSIRAKLSALKYLVDADLPAFVLRLEYDKDDNISFARLLHIGNEQIERILHRTRLAEFEGVAELQSISLSLSLRNARRITENGSDFYAEVHKAIGTDASENIKSKIDFRKSCGYHEGGRIGKFIFESKSKGPRELVDLMLGAIPALKVRELQLENIRFGISLPKDTQIIKDATLSIDVKPVTSGSVEVRNGEDSSRLNVDVIVPLIPGLPDEEKRIRIKNSFIDCIINFGTGSAQFNFSAPQETIFKIRTLSDYLKFGSLLSKPGSRLAILILNSFPELSLSETANFQSWDVLHEFAELIALAAFKQRMETEINLSLPELLESFEKNKNYFAMITRPGLGMSFKSQPALNTFVDKAIFVIPAVIRLRQFDYLSVLKIKCAEMRRSGETVHFTGGQPETIYESIVPTSKADPWLFAGRKAIELGKTLRHEADSVIVPELIHDPITQS